MKRPAATYTSEHIERWLRANSDGLKFYFEELRRGETEKGYAYWEIARAHERLGLTQIALAQYGKALGHFSAAVGAWAYLLERYVAGEEVERELLEHLSSKPFNLALAATDQDAIKRLVPLYAEAFPIARTGSNNFHWAGMVVSLLASGKMEEASEWIAHPHPKLPPVSIRYLNALLEGDESAFREHCNLMSEEWKDTIRSEGLKCFPDAVCDHTQIGSIRLFERLWGYRPNVDLEAAKIPPEIFDAVAEPVEGAL